MAQEESASIRGRREAAPELPEMSPEDRRKSFRVVQGGEKGPDKMAPQQDDSGASARKREAGYARDLRKAVRGSAKSGMDGLQGGSAYPDDVEKAAGSRKERLSEVAKEAKKTANPIGAILVASQVKIADAPYLIAFAAGGLKDLLDLATAGTVIMPIIFTIMFVPLIFLMMLLGDMLSGSHGSSGRKVRKTAARYLVLGGTIFAELLPGLNFLPVTASGIAIAYYVVLLERRIAKKTAEKERKSGHGGDGEQLAA